MKLNSQTMWEFNGLPSFTAPHNSRLFSWASAACAAMTPDQACARAGGYPGQALGPTLEKSIQYWPFLRIPAPTALVNPFTSRRDLPDLRGSSQGHCLHRRSKAYPEDTRPPE